MDATPATLVGERGGGRKEELVGWMCNIVGRYNVLLSPPLSFPFRRCASAEMNLRWMPV